MLSVLERILIYPFRYYCRYYLMGKVTASDHLMFVALVSKLFPSYTVKLTGPRSALGETSLPTTIKTYRVVAIESVISGDQYVNRFSS